MSSEAEGFAQEMEKISFAETDEDWKDRDMTKFALEFRVNLDTGINVVVDAKKRPVYSGRIPLARSYRNSKLDALAVDGIERKMNSELPSSIEVSIEGDNVERKCWVVIRAENYADFVARIRVFRDEYAEKTREKFLKLCEEGK